MSGASGRRVLVGTMLLGTLLGVVLPRLLEPGEADAGVSVIGGTSTLPAGGGSGGSGLPDGGPDNSIVRADGIATAIQTSAVTIDDSGNLSVPISATVDGRDLSADGIILDALPLDPLPSSMMSPGDASFVQGVYRGSTYTNNGDTGVQIPACVLSMPLRSACRVRVRWQAAVVSGLDAGAAVSGAASWCRVYSFYTSSTGIGAAPNAVSCETDHAGVTAGITVQFDGSVLQPTFQGPAATNLRLDCFVDDIACVYNP